MKVMRKLLVLMTVSMWVMANAAYAQQPQSYTQPQAEPVYLLNSTTIINGALADFAPSDIQGIEVYKLSMRTNDSIPLPWQTSIGTAGVLIIKSTRRVPAKSLSQLGRRLKLSGPLQFAIDGHWLNAEATSKLHITPAAIAQLHTILPADSQSATVVDIWLKRMPKKEHPPGSIFIR